MSNRISWLARHALVFMALTLLFFCVPLTHVQQYTTAELGQLLPTNGAAYDPMQFFASRTYMVTIDGNHPCPAEGEDGGVQKPFIPRLAGSCWAMTIPRNF